jgi:hypothetical protein
MPASTPRKLSSGTKGQNPETSWRMAKTGNAYLRSAAYKMAVVGTQHNPVIRAHYLRRRAQGKSAMNAIGHLHVQGPGHCLERLAFRSRLRPHPRRPQDLTRPYGF